MSGTNLPPGWAWATLGEVATSVKNGMYVSRPGAAPDGVPILRINAVRPMRLSTADLRYTGMTVAEVEARDGLAKPGNLLFTRYNGNVDLVGSCARVPDQAPVMAYPDKLIRATVAGGIDSRFLCYAWSWAETQAQVRERVRTTAGQAGISGSSLKSIRVPVAPLAEQHRIVEALEDHLSRLDAAAANVRNAAARSHHLWSSALSQLAEGLHGAEAVAEKVSVSEVALVSGGIQKQRKRAPVQNKYPFLRVANVGRGNLDLTEIHQVELFDGELEKYRLARGDLLVVEGNGSPDQIGRAGSWRGEIENAVHQNHLIRVRPGERLLPRYLELIWNSPLVIDQLREVARSTSGLYTLSTSKVKAVRIPVPSLPDQAVLVGKADTWETCVGSATNALRQATARSESLRRSLLHRAFTGRLVPQDPDDEPASVLLDRIRAELGAQSVKPQRKRWAPAKAGGTAGPSPAPEAKPIPADAVQQELPL